MDYFNCFCWIRFLFCFVIGEVCFVVVLLFLFLYEACFCIVYVYR